MEKKKVVSVALVGMLSMGILSGCGIADTQAEVSKDAEIQEEVREIITVGENALEQYKEVPEAKTFEPGEHIFFIRYLYGTNPSYISSGNIVVPDGYSVMEIENFTERDGYGSRTNGVDVWFINTETVLVEPVYKEEYSYLFKEHGYFDYSHPGVVLDLELNDEMTLTK